MGPDYTGPPGHHYGHPVLQRQAPRLPRLPGHGHTADARSGQQVLTKTITITVGAKVNHNKCRVNIVYTKLEEGKNIGSKEKAIQIHISPGIGNLGVWSKQTTCWGRGRVEEGLEFD